MTGSIFLVRHGETEWNRMRRYQGWLDSPLTEAGIGQAQAIGRLLRGVADAATAEIVASPIGRARRTAKLIQAELGDGRVLTYDERLREISIGAWDGLDRDEIAAQAPDILDGYDSSWYFRAPGGETYDGFAGRIAAWLAEVEGRSVIAVTHGVVTRVMRGLYAGLPHTETLSLPVPQDRIFRLCGGTIEELGV
jgi:broad specificity phosphatase PhoE